MASTMSDKLPPGFILDGEPQLPPGFTLDDGFVPPVQTITPTETPVEEGPKFEGNFAQAAIKSLTNAIPESLIGAADVGLTVGSNIAGTVAGGLLGIPASLAGNDAATDVVKGTQEFIGVGPFTESGRGQLEALMKGGEVVSGITNMAIANLIDLSNRENTSTRIPEENRRPPDPFANEVRDRGFRTALGDFGADPEGLGGGPIGGAALQTLPDAILSFLGIKGIGKKLPDDVVPPKVDVPGSKVPAPLVTQGKPVATVGAPKLDAPVDITPPATIIDHLRKNRPAALAEEVLPDPAVLESAQRLGVDLNPEHYSSNSIFQDVTRALKSEGGSKLQGNEVKVLGELADKADDLVVRAGGSADKAGISESIRAELTETIKTLKGSAQTAYDTVNKAIPKGTKVNPVAIVEFLNQKIKDLGRANLDSTETALFNLVGKDMKSIPTYAALDRVRSEIGRGFSRRGVFAEADDAVLSEVYGLLSDVQNNVARSFGVGSTYTGARRLVESRKALEASSLALFGRDLAKSMVPVIQAAATELPKGTVTAFNKLMNTVPPARRAEVAATVMGEIFGGTTGRAGALGTGFVQKFISLNRNPTAKELLFKHLDEATQQRYNDLGTVMTAIVKSNTKPLANPSGSAAGIIKAINEMTLPAKIYDVGKQAAGKAIVAEIASTAVGFPGAGTTGVVGGILAKGRTARSVSADELIASPEFLRAINKAVAGQIAEADAIAAQSAAFKKWTATLSEADAQAIATGGFIAWITDEEI